MEERTVLDWSSFGLPRLPDENENSMLRGTRLLVRRKGFETLASNGLNAFSPIQVNSFLIGGQGLCQKLELLNLERFEDDLGDEFHETYGRTLRSLEQVWRACKICLAPFVPRHGRRYGWSSHPRDLELFGLQDWDHLRAPLRVALEEECGGEDEASEARRQRVLESLQEGWEDPSFIENANRAYCILSGGASLGSLHKQFGETCEAGEKMIWDSYLELVIDHLHCVPSAVLHLI